MDFAPTGPLQDELLDHVRARYEHVRGERVCSGRALPDLYAFRAWGRLLATLVSRPGR